MTHYSQDGTATGIAMRATDKGREFSLIAMVQGDRRDAQIFGFMARDNGLDCGHVNIHAMPGRAFPGYCGGTGYGVDHATGTRKCYACCAQSERASMIATGRATLYLVRRSVTVAPSDTDGRPLEETAALRANPKATVMRYFVTDWAGELEFKTLPGIRHGAGGFGSQRTDAWFVGPDGFVWHAVNRGDNDIARCRRTKVKA